MSLSLLRRLRAAAAALSGALALAVPSFADDIGPAVGAAIPDGFSAADHTGAQKTLADLAGEEGLILFFVRSADWCPVCKAQIAELDNRYSELETAGYNAAVITTDSPDTLSGVVDGKGYRFTLLADPDSDLIKTWDLVDPQFASGRHAGLPYPATFILGPDGVVKDKLLEEAAYGQERAYATRVPFDDIAAAALAVRAGG